MESCRRAGGPLATGARSGTTATARCARPMRSARRHQTGCRSRGAGARRRRPAGTRRGRPARACARSRRSTARCRAWRAARRAARRRRRRWSSVREPSARAAGGAGDRPDPRGRARSTSGLVSAIAAIVGKSLGRPVEAVDILRRAAQPSAESCVCAPRRTVICCPTIARISISCGSAAPGTRMPGTAATSGASSGARRARRRRRSDRRPDRTGAGPA